ncbi:MAG: DUF4124 domain-containing protein [Thiohalophilus sp.]
MNKYCLILLLLFTLPAVAADKIYKKVNPDGSVEYSDEPFEGSEEMPSKRIPSMSFEKSPDIDFQSPARDDQDADASYEVSVTSPANDESIRDNTGNVTLQGRVAPGLRGGHSLRWILDGEALDDSGSSVQLSNVDRGTHTVKLEVVDNDGEVLAASSSVTFHLLRHSAIPPANPAPNYNPPKPQSAPSP